VDTYTHNDSTWLIFTDKKQWVIELTDSKTLWYNYNFFKQIFEFTSLDVVQNQHFITKWVEDNIMNGSKNTASPSQTPSYNLMEVFENGIKETCWNPEDNTSWVEGVIKGGVKETWELMNELPNKVKKIIKKGVKISTPRQYVGGDIIDKVIDKGDIVFGTFVGGKRQKEDVESVIGYGTKNPTD
jgi:hypothetical protein